MHIDVNTGDGLDGKEALERWTAEFLRESLSRFRDQITRVEVQLTDENKAKKGAADMRCMLEARVTGHPPVVISYHGGTMDEAIRGATDRIVRALARTLGKLDRHEHRSRETIRREMPTASDQEEQSP